MLKDPQRSHVITIIIGRFSKLMRTIKMTVNAISEHVF